MGNRNYFRCCAPRSKMWHRKAANMKSVETTHYNYRSRMLLETEGKPDKGDPTPELTTYGGIKLGWIQGVLIPCLLNIWGVMLFLRIAWIVAQAGIGFTILIILVSSVVCVITTLSLSAICTNGEVSGGGVYYLVSRSLGAELGASVGIIFAFANAVAASMNTIGFCESLNDLLRAHGLKILDNGNHDTRIVGAIALFVMCFICAIGMDWETKTQNFLIVIILLAIFNFVIGASIGPTSNSERARGFVGLNLQTAGDNWLPDYRDSDGQAHHFFSVFAMYFPAVTGVQAGANICGDLKNPSTAIPKGTLMALAISISSYFLMAVLAGMGARRDASGHVGDLLNNTLTECKPKCNYGLHNSYEIMQLMAFWGPLIYAGCWAATLSTALTNLLSVPRLIQALGTDRIYPGLIFFSKPYGKHGEPYRGYVLTFCVSLLFLLIADLNTIAPLITNFYLASYALINFCTFHAAFTKAISWRPAFRYFNTWLSLSGFIICIGIMVVISWYMFLATVGIFFTLYLIVLYRRPAASWGSSTDASRYKEAVSSLLQMSRRATHVKEYWPQPLVLCGEPATRRALLDVAAMLTVSGSFMVVADISPKKYTFDEYAVLHHNMEEWMITNKYRAFFVMLDECEFEEGSRVLLQCTGLGRFTPNILLIGYKCDWVKAPHKDLLAYVDVIRHAFEERRAVCVFRMPPPPPLPFVSEQAPLDGVELRAHSRVQEIMHSSSDFDLSETVVEDADSEHQVSLLRFSPPSRDPNESFFDSVAMNDINTPHKSNMFEQFDLDQSKCLDAWWLYDDGGLNILLPYLIAIRGVHGKMNLRIFALARQNHDIDDAKKCMEMLLQMYRIEYTELKMVIGLQYPPTAASIDLFNSYIQSFKTGIGNNECIVTDEELARQYQKTCRHLRLREMVMENSELAGLIVMSLPMPRKNTVSAPLYMAWLEVISSDLPPMLLVRGNHTSVLYA